MLLFSSAKHECVFACVNMSEQLCLITSFVLQKSFVSYNPALSVEQSLNVRNSIWICSLIYQLHVWLLIVVMLTSPCSFPPTPQPSSWLTVCCRGAVYAIIGWLIGWRVWRRPWFIWCRFCTEPMTSSSDDDSLTSERWSRGGLCLSFTPIMVSCTQRKNR